jgi:hypothetical protein
MYFKANGNDTKKLTGRKNETSFVLQLGQETSRTSSWDFNISGSINQSHFK